MSESVRMCKLEDAEQLCEIIRNELGYSETIVDDVRASLQKMLDNDDYFTLAVVEDSGVICGFITSVREVSLEAGEYYCILALAVKKEFQRQRLGTTLITLVESKARLDGAALITLSSQFKRTEAHEFYEKLGYEKTSFAFKKKFV